MLEHTGTRYRSFLGHMSYDEKGDPHFLGEP